MNVSQLVFSPTGGTQKAADIIAKALGTPVTKTDLTDAGIDFSAISLKKEDIAVIAVPSYGGRVPSPAALRISQIHGCQTPCILICVYGNRAYEDTLTELSDLAEKSGFHVIAAIAAVAEHSIMRQFAAGRPDAEDQQELQAFAGEILEKIRNHPTAPCTAQIPGNRPYKKGMGAGLIPKADSRCTRCGLCAEKCPAQAISRENPRDTDSKKCISCMRCARLCPQSARKVNGALVSVASMAIKKACSTRKRNELYL